MMKKTARLLCAFLAVMMLLSLSAASLAENEKVYIPVSLSRYHVPTLDEIWDKLFYLTIKVDSIPTYNNPYDPNDPCPILMTDDADVEFWFRDGQGNPFVPDWFYVNFHISDGGWVELPVNSSGYAMYNSEGYKYPMGGGPWYGPRVLYTRYNNDDPGDPAWHALSNFVAGKTYEDGTSMVLSFANSGLILSVDYIMPDMDYFRLPTEGAKTSVTYRTNAYPVKADEGTPKERILYYLLYDLSKHEALETIDYHISDVCTEYPTGNNIRTILTQWLNLEKNNLLSYIIAYAVTDEDVYAITYMPQDRRGWKPDFARAGIFFRNNQLMAGAFCTEDHPFDTYWYTNGRRTPAKLGLKPFTQFATSPRVLK